MQHRLRLHQILINSIDTVFQRVLENRLNLHLPLPLEPLDHMDTLIRDIKVSTTIQLVFNRQNLIDLTMPSSVAEERIGRISGVRRVRTRGGNPLEGVPNIQRVRMGGLAKRVRRKNREGLEEITIRSGQILYNSKISFAK
jgi:hypothetical protein